MALLQEWQKIAYNEQADRAKLQKFWQDYFLVEKGIYEKLLDHPDEEVSGTVLRMSLRMSLRKKREIHWIPWRKTQL